MQKHNGPIKKHRIEAFFERVNEIVGGVKTDVNVQKAAREFGFRQDKHRPDPYIEIFSKEDSRITPKMKAHNYHELSHLMYSYSDTSKMDMSSNWMWYNLEDSRIETLFSKGYPGAGSYFETEMLDEILNSGDPNAADHFVPTYMRRHFTTKPYYEAYENAFRKKYGDKIANEAIELMDKFMVTKDFFEQKKLAEQLAIKLNKSFDYQNIQRSSNGKASSKSAQKMIESVKQDIEAEKTQSANSKGNEQDDSENESEGESENETDEESDSESKDNNGKTEPEQKETSNTQVTTKADTHGPAPSLGVNKTQERKRYDNSNVKQEDVIEQMKKAREQLKDEQVKETEFDNDVAFDVQKFEDAQKIQTSVERMLRDYRAGNQPEEEYKKRNGFVDIKRAMHPRERLDIFYKVDFPYNALDFNLQIYVDTSGSMETGGYNKKTRGDIALDIAKGVAEACENFNCPTEVIQFESYAKVILPFSKNSNTKFHAYDIGMLGGGTSLGRALDVGFPTLEMMCKKNSKPGVIIIISDGRWECECDYRDIKETYAREWRKEGRSRTCIKLEDAERIKNWTIAPIIFDENRNAYYRHGLKDARWIKDDLSDLDIEVKKVLDKVEQRILGVRL